MSDRVVVGVEQVLVAAAVDDRFRQAILSGDRAEAAEAKGLSLGASEQAMLRAIPREQLEAAILAVDISPDNMARRSFLRSVAVSAAVVAAVDGAVGCSDDTDKPPQDMAVQDLPMATGIRPDMAPPVKKDAGAQVDKAPTPDVKAGLDHLGSFGIRPKG
jgi:hypothetical protein